MINRVRVGSLYTFQAVGVDIYDPPHGVDAGTLVKGQVVRVVNLAGCPRCGTMGMCYVAHRETGKFLGLVLCNSLTKFDRYAK